MMSMKRFDVSDDKAQSFITIKEVCIKMKF